MGSPVYIQIHNQLRENIEGGKWQVGEKIPAERELAAELGGQPHDPAPGDSNPC